MSLEHTQQEEISMEQAVASLLRDLPKPVQDFVTGPERSRIALSLSEKYKLHIDQAGAFEHAYMFMLLGISSPEEFVESLAKAGISSDVIQGLVSDVNQQVFIPLRKAEQRPPLRTPAPPAVPRAQAPAPILPGSTEPVPAAQPAPAPQPVTQAPAVNYGYMQPPIMQPPQAVYGPAPYGVPVYMWPQAPMPPQQWMQPQPMQQYMPEQQAVAPQQAYQTPVEQPVLRPIPLNTVTIQPPKPIAVPIQNEYGADPYREPFK